MQSGTQSDHVNLRDFKRVLAACGIKTKSARDQERAKAIFHKIDADNSGTIDFNEFVQGLYGVDRTVSERILGCGLYTRILCTLRLICTCIQTLVFMLARAYRG